MDKRIARYIVAVSFRSMAPLQQMLPLLKEHCTQEEYQVYSRAIATVIAEIGLELNNKVFASHPELKQEIEKDMEKYGRIL